MPRKTKKQKISSELRRRQKSASQGNLPASRNVYNLVKRQNDRRKGPVSSTPSSAYVYRGKPVAKPKTEVSYANYAYVAHDLIKITIFTAIALAFQGMLYFLLYRG